MPRGPKGEKRPADVNARAVMIAKIATGEIEDKKGSSPNRAKGGKAGGKARADSLNPARRKQIAEQAAAERWKNKLPK